MYPRIAGIGVYYPVLAFAIAANAALTFYLLAREGFRIRLLVLYATALALAGIAGSKLYSLVVEGGVGTLDFELAGGWRYPGAMLGVLIAAVALRDRLPAGLTLARYLDAWVPGFALALAIGRVGCLLHGCCYGTITDVPWAWSYPPGSLAWYEMIEAGVIDWGAPASASAHPLPLYFLILELYLFVFCLGLRMRKRYDGQVLLMFLAIHGPIKAALEFLRFEYDPLHQIVFPIGLLAAAILLVHRLRNRRQGAIVVSPVSVG